METRGRKRVDATGQRPLPPRSKKIRESGDPRVQDLSMEPGKKAPSSSLKRDLGRTSRNQQDKPVKDLEHEKGKEKQVEKERQHNDQGGTAGYNYSEIWHPNIVSAGSALQGLFKKLGAEFMSPDQSNQFKEILAGLRAEGDEDRQSEALSQLCELLSMATENSMSSFSVDSFVPLLVGLLNQEQHPNMMLLAARALTNLCDVLPSSCDAVVHYGAVRCLCARLLTIEYIDVAEQSLQALEKISHEHPMSCLKEGALIAALSYLDFFPTSVQRVAVSTAANLCRQLPSDTPELFVMDAVPILTNLLQYQDSKVVEHASICLTRIAQAFASSPEKLDALCSHGLIPHVARLISLSSLVVSQIVLSNSTVIGLIRLLSICVGGSAEAAQTLHFLNISSIVREVIAGSGLASSISFTPSAVNRPPEQLCEIVSLVNELLPPIPQAHPSKRILAANNISKKHITGRSGRSGDGRIQVTSAREKFLLDHPEVLAQFGKDLMPVLVQVCGSSVNSLVRHKCLSALNKVIYFATTDMLVTLLKDLNISSFLAGVLASKDPSLIVTALQIAEMLLQKFPDIFKKLFVKEGLIQAVDMLIAFQTSPSDGTNASALISAKIPQSRSRRGGSRRPSGSSGQLGTPDTKISISFASNFSSSSERDITTQTAKTGLWTVVITTAKHIMDTYFPSDSLTADALFTESLCKLQSLCSKLNGDMVPQTKSKWKGKGKAGRASFSTSMDEQQMFSVVSEILTELSRHDGVSTFEFVRSGVVAALLNFFSCGNQTRENISDAKSSRLPEEVWNRLKKFVMLLSPSLVDQRTKSSLKILVQKLQDALSSLECFSVILSPAPKTGSSTGNHAGGLSTLSKPFKLRFCKAPGDKSLRDFSFNILVTDPLANLAYIEEYLWPRVQQTDLSHLTSSILDGCGAAAESEELQFTSRPGAMEHRPFTRSRNSEAARKQDTVKYAGLFKGNRKGKVGVQAVHKGPETRSAAARKRSEAARALFESDDDGINILPVQLEEAVEMEEDISEDVDEEVFGEEIAPAYLSDYVLDVTSGDGLDAFVASSSVKSNDQASKPASGISGAAGTLLGSRSVAGSIFEGRFEFSLAAMAGLASAGGRGINLLDEQRSLKGFAASDGPARLTFTLDGKPLNRSLTVFQAIHRQVVAAKADEEQYRGQALSSAVEGRKLWANVYTIYYQRAELNTQESFSTVSSSDAPFASIHLPKVKNTRNHHMGSRLGCSWQHSSPLDTILHTALPCDLDKLNPTYDILLLLRILEGINRFVPWFYAHIATDAFAEGKIESRQEFKIIQPLVCQDDFLSSKLTAKLARQMQDVLVLFTGTLPTWCHQLTRSCPFLFPFEIRRQYFQATAFGPARALQRLQQQQSVHSPDTSSYREPRFHNRVPRQKVCVSRNHILSSALKFMKSGSGHMAVLEVEFSGEVGTGLGPTLEFYTLLSHELQRASLGMWRTHSILGSIQENIERDLEMRDSDFEPIENSSDRDETKVGREHSMGNALYTHSPNGLFPRPWPTNSEVSCDRRYEKVIEYFRLLGYIVAKSLQDGRLLDLPLSIAFYKLMLGQELDVYDIRYFDTELGATLEEMHNLVCRRKYMESAGAYKIKDSELRFRGVKIEDLCLDFTIPGYPDYVLKPGGDTIMVDLNNLEEYVSLMVDATVNTGISAQMEAFCAGFNLVFPVSSLQIFTAEEINYMICGQQELWLPEELVEHIKFDHGYTASCQPIKNLLEIMGEFNVEKQRAFLQFVTGAPRLGPGGLAALNPKLTIVRKHPTGTSGAATSGSSPTRGSSALGTTLADGDLPSVMTCANYLKLPPYSSKEVMRERLLYAITEGQGYFDLS